VTKIGLLVLFIPLLAAPGCNSGTPADPSPPPGPAIASLAITANCFDEYYRSIDFTSGWISVSLTGTGITRNVTLTPGSQVVLFDSLPIQQYQLTESREGFYTVVYPIRFTASYYHWTFEPWLVRIPTASFRVDSISAVVNSITPRVMVRFTYGTTLPPGGRRSPIVFASTSADVSPRYGAYAYTVGFDDTSATTGQFGDLYQAMQWAGFVTGERIYLTCRLVTGGTRSQMDSLSGLLVYTGLETNTTATTSFIMP